MPVARCGLVYRPCSNAHGPHPERKLACALILLLALTGTHASAQTLRLRSRAVVSTDRVTVASITQLRGEGPLTNSVLDDLQLPIDLSSGRKSIVSRKQLIEALTQAQVNMAAIIVAGATQCAITREQPAPQAKSQAIATATSESATAPKPPALSLRSYIRDYVARALHVDQEQVDLEFQAHDALVLELVQDEYEFRMLDDDRIDLGRTVLKVGVRRHQGEWERYYLSSQVAATLPVVVAKRPLNRGHVIGEQDIEVRPQRLTNWNDVSVQDRAAAIGQRTKAPVRPGAIVRAEVLEAVPLVVRGQLATIWFRDDGLAIKTVARAMEDGYLGQHAQFRNENSKQIFTAVVTGEGIGLVNGNVSRMQAL